MTTTHVGAARLLDYYLGGAPEDESGVEEHLFACARCGEVLDDIHRLGTSIVALVRAGEVSSGATTALLNRMSRDRLNVRQYTIAPGQTVACTVTAADDFMAGRFVLPAGDFERLDMRVVDSNGQELMRVNDIVVDVQNHHAVVFFPARPVLEEESALTHYVLVVPDGSGERELSRYSMDHTSAREG